MHNNMSNKKSSSRISHVQNLHTWVLMEIRLYSHGHLGMNVDT